MKIRNLVISSERKAWRKTKIGKKKRKKDKIGGEERRKEVKLLGERHSGGESK